MHLDVGLLSQAFELGASCQAPMQLAGGSSATRYLLRTDLGRWMVKTTWSPPAWELNQMRVSGALEQAAYRAGVPMPRPVEPCRAAVGYWACLNEGGVYARVSKWIDGVAPTKSVDTSLAGWLGSTLAVIEHLALPGDHRAEAAYPVQSVAEWRLWLDEARAAGLLDVRVARRLSAAVTDATALIQAALAADPAFQLAHRDVNRRNILLTDRGPLLLDFDYAGPEVPWWEFVHHAFDLASSRLGDHPPRPEQVDVALTAYQQTGASAGPAQPEAFAGLLRATLGAAAYNLWLALGHRPADADRRTTAAQVVRDLASRLPTIVTSIDRWTRLIR